MSISALRSHVTGCRNHVKALEKTLQPLETEDDFFAIYDALQHHKSDFVANRESLLAAWKRGGELYTLRIKETQALFDDYDLRMKLALWIDAENPDVSWLNLPIFCWRDHDDACIMLWTAPHIRRLGLARELLGLLGIARAYRVLPASRPFWEHVAIPEYE